jgi:triosephosphate isomerase
VYLTLGAGLAPILFVGEAGDEEASLVEALEIQLARVLEGCEGPQMAATMAFVYEPEGAIGVSAPTAPEHVAAGCEAIRNWLRNRWGDAMAEDVRIVYGGSVAPEHAPGLLVCPELDGLAATRRGRNAATFAEIVRLIAGARTG